MKNQKNMLVVSILIIIIGIIITAVGLFYDNGGTSFLVKSVHGEIVEIFGNGVYQYDNYFKAPINKGTDAVILFLVLPLYLFLLVKGKSKKTELLKLGLLGTLLYYSASIAFGVAYNFLFLLYLILFSLCLFAFIYQFQRVVKLDLKFKKNMKEKGLKIFLILAGLSVFVWLIEVIASLRTGNPPEILGVNTTEPTFVLDIGLIAPLAFLSVYLISKKNIIGYIMASILLTLNTIIGIMIISQSFFQFKYDIVLSIKEIIPYVSIFIIMGSFAVYFNTKLFKNLIDK